MPKSINTTKSNILSRTPSELKYANLFIQPQTAYQKAGFAFVSNNPGHEKKLGNLNQIDCGNYFNGFSATDLDKNRPPFRVLHPMESAQTFRGFENRRTQH
jgi:hypothetical protein